MISSSPPLSIHRRMWRRISDTTKIPRQWWWAPAPATDFATPESLDLWERQHDVVSHTVQRMMFTVGSFGVFCLVTLAASDVSLVSKTATIKLPVAQTDMSFTAFLAIGPAALILLTAYLHVYLGQHRLLGRPEGRSGLPVLCNVPTRTARLIVILFCYILSPLVLFVFSIKASPQPDFAKPLPYLTVGWTAVLIWLAQRRLAPDKRRVRSGVLWLIQCGLVVIMLSPGTMASFVARPLNLSRAELAKQDLRRANLEEANLYDANLEEANLEGANLEEANLEEANLEGANLYDANLKWANLYNANLEGANLKGANLELVYLYNANLEGANLKGANLEGAHLYNANLKGANLEGANLEGANLKGADLRGAKHVMPDQLGVACVNATTTLPEGVSPPPLPTKACKRWKEQ